MGVAIVGLVAAGCGGSSNSDKQANSAYADSVCTAIGNWQQDIKGIASDFSGGISKTALQSKVDQAQTRTKKLASEIRAVPHPNTSEGKAAREQLDQLTSDLTSAVDAAKSTVSHLQGNASASTIASSLAALAPQVQTLVQDARTAVSSLKSAGGSLASAFQDSSACKNLT